jgi:hypothetical protein
MCGRGELAVPPHFTAKQRGYEMVHPFTEDAWGLRMVFVRAPDGNVINRAGHSDE